MTLTRDRSFRKTFDFNLLILNDLWAIGTEKNMLDPNKKKRVIEKYKTHATDTGSPQVQIALLTEEIKDLTDHLRTHKKDFSSRRGLIKKVGERRRLMKYLKREDAKSYDELMAKLKV